MALTYSPTPELGKMAAPFSLKGTDKKVHSLDEFGDAKALVVVFMCNHCPYVIATQERINQIAQDYADKGLKIVGINSNDATNYPDDDFESMIKRAEDEG